MSDEVGGGFEIKISEAGFVAPGKEESVQPASDSKWSPQSLPPLEHGGSEMRPLAGSERSSGSDVVSSPNNEEKKDVKSQPDGKSAPAMLGDPIQFDRQVRKSAFVKHQTRLYLGEVSDHYLSLFWATCMVVITVLDLITDWMLAYDYYFRLHDAGAAASLIVIHGFTAIVQIYIVWCNSGQWNWFLLDIFQLRIVVDYVAYVKEWPSHRGKRWAQKDFYGSSSFSTFAKVFPSLIVQVYVIVQYNYYFPSTSWVQRFSLAMSIGHAIIDILHHFKYVSVHREIWFYQMIKAFINTGLRTLLVAMLVERLGLWTWFWAAISYLFGLGVYLLSIFISKRQKRDDPLKWFNAHLIFGNLVAVNLLFASFPFAPNHSIEDWWLGYMIGDTKLQIENALMMATVVNLWQTRDILYYAGVFFACTALIANFAALKILDNSVRQQLEERGIYSAQLIVKLFAHWCAYYKKNLEVDFQRRSGLNIVQKDKSSASALPAVELKEQA